MNSGMIQVLCLSYFKSSQGNKAIPKPNDNDRVRAEMWAKRDKEIASRLACFEVTFFDCTI